MDRRKFIKNTLITVAGTAVIGTAAVITKKGIKTSEGDKKNENTYYYGKP